MDDHNRQPEQAVRTVVADPSALGLFGLAIVTLVASSQKLGITSEMSYELPWAVFLGACAQLYASISDAKLNNTFGSTAFGAYSFFWLSMALSWLIKYGVLGAEMQAAIDARQLGFAYLGYFLFSLYMTVGAAGTHKVLFSIFILIDFLFLGLSMNAFNIFPEAGHYIAAYAELFIAIMSFYGSAAALLNTHYRRTMLPVGKAMIKRS